MLKKAIKIIPVLLLVFGCKKEYSCENCKPPVTDTIPVIDTIPITDTISNDTVPDTDTIPNELIAKCSIYIQDESEVRKIYAEVRTKLWPGHHVIFDSIEMNGRHQYDTLYNLKKYLRMSDYKKRDTFFFRAEIRWRFLPASFLEDTILIY